MDLAALSARLTENGIDPATILEEGAEPLVAHAARHAQDAGPWLEVLAGYVDAVKRMEVGYWGPLRFCIPQVAKVAGADPTCFGALISKVERLLEVVASRTSDWVRTQEYGIPVAAEALVGSPEALHRALDLAIALAEQGAAPGWLLQLAIPSLWRAADQNPEAFSALLDALERTALSLHASKVHVGYPFATGVAALAQQQDVGACFAAWLERLGRVGRSLSDTSLQPYATFEYGVPGLVDGGAIPPAELTAALELAAQLADLGMNPARVLDRTNSHAPFGRPLSTGRFAQLGIALARDGVDPYFPLAFGAPAALEVAERLGDEEGDALVDRVMALARALHAEGLPDRQLFEDGFASLLRLEERSPGLFEKGVSLAEHLTRRGLPSGPSIAFGLPRALGQLPPGHPAVALCFESAATLAEVGAEPFALLSYAFGPLWELAGHEAARLKPMLASLERLVATLVHEGIDVHAVLFHDVRGLAEAGGEAHAFIDLLGRVERLFEALRSADIDPRPMSDTGLPAAARESNGRPWMLVSALETARALAERGRDPTPLFSQSLEALGAAAGQDAEAFTSLLRSVEGRFARLSPELLGPATTAACMLAGADAEVLGDVLGRLADRFTDRASESDQRLIAALPLLAEAAGDPASLFELIDATEGALEALADTPRALEVWVQHGLPAVPIVSARKPREALALIPRLLERTTRLEPRALALEVGAARIAWMCEGDPERFLAHLLELDALARELAAEGQSSSDLPLRLSDAVEIARAAERASGSFGAALAQLLGILERHRADPALPHLLALAKDVSELHPLAWSELVSPTLAVQGRPVPVLSVLEEILRWHARNAPDLRLLQEIVTQQGVRAADILRDLIAPALRMGALRNLTEDRERLLSFIRDIGLFEPTLWVEYRRIWSTEGLSEREKQARSSALVSKISRLTEHLRNGELTSEDQEDPLLGTALVQTFPPAVASGQERALAICRAFPDHPEHLDARDPGPSLRSRSYRLARGSWQLRAQEALNAEAWAPAVEALSNLPEPPEAAALGWQLLTAWVEGHIGREGARKPLLSRVLARAKAAGVALPAGARTAAELIALRELLADKCREGVEEALLAARAEAPDRYERLIRVKLLPRPKVGAGLVRAVRQTLEAAREGRLPAPEAKARLEGQLQAFTPDLEALLSLASPMPQEVRLALEALPPREQPLDAGKEVDRLHADFLGQDVKRMQEALFGGAGKPGALEYRLASEAVEVRFEPTKRKAHAAVGVNEGVCVAEDLRLWNTPEFLQLVIWSSDGVAQGGVHLLVVEDEGGGRLALPGINPSRALLEDVGTAPVLDAVVDFAWRLARAWGLVGVWLPAQPWIHSNRSEVHREIAARGWPTRKVRLHPFSYSPYSYSFDEVLEVPERYLPDRAPAESDSPAPSRT